jgi:hypothetical protein
LTERRLFSESGRARLPQDPPDPAPSGTDFLDVGLEEKEMLVSILHNTGILYYFAYLTALLVLAVVTSKDAPCRESELSTFSSKWLAPVPDDVRRSEIARGVRRFLTLQLLASCTRECNSKFRDAICRIRRGV